MMSEPIDFYFDFSSPYGYFGSERIGEVAARHGREVRWHPILAGMVFKTTGAVPLVNQPLKREYAFRDFERTARKLGVPFRIPAPFPFRSVLAASAFYAIEDHGQAIAFARAIYRMIFGQGVAPMSEGQLLEAAATAGLDGNVLLERMATGDAERRCLAATEAAIARGVCGSPFFLVDGEPFWGQDRLADVDEWLARGGW